MAWSGGKDSTLALHEILKSNAYHVVALLTTVTRDYDRVSMHGIRQVLLEQQAESLELPLEKVFISKNCSNEEYESVMREVLMRYLKQGVEASVFGDVSLEHVRKYRERNLSRIGMKGVFPLWQKETSLLARTFMESGFRAVITCVDTEALDGSFPGRLYDEQFLADLPATVDPCGENGEFHSFVYDGPIFSKPILHTLGERILRDNRFQYCDVLPASRDNVVACDPKAGTT